MRMNGLFLKYHHHHPFSFRTAVMTATLVVVTVLTMVMMMMTFGPWTAPPLLSLPSGGDGWFLPLVSRNIIPFQRFEPFLYNNHNLHRTGSTNTTSTTTTTTMTEYPTPPPLPLSLPLERSLAVSSSMMEDVLFLVRFQNHNATNTSTTSTTTTTTLSSSTNTKESNYHTTVNISTTTTTIPTTNNTTTGNSNRMITNTTTTTTTITGGNKTNTTSTNTTGIIANTTTTITTNTTQNKNNTNTNTNRDDDDDDDIDLDHDDDSIEETYCGYNYLYRRNQQSNNNNSTHHNNSTNNHHNNSTNNHNHNRTTTSPSRGVPPPTDHELKIFYERYIQNPMQFPTITSNLYEATDQYDNRTLHVLIYFANLPLPNPNITEDDFESIPQNSSNNILVTYQNTNPQFNSRDDVRNFVARSIARMILQCPTYHDFNTIFLHPQTQPFSLPGTSARTTTSTDDDDDENSDNNNNNGGQNNGLITIGSSNIQIQCHRDGDYDFALMDLLLLSYTIRQQYPNRTRYHNHHNSTTITTTNSTNDTNYTNTTNHTNTTTTTTPNHHEIISSEAQYVLENIMLSVGLTGKMESKDGTTTSYELPCQIRDLPFLSSRRQNLNIYLQIDDTENHTLMIQVAKYLINQLYFTYYPELRVHDQLYNNDANGNTNKLLYLLSTFMNQEQFYEYNSKPYQGSTVVAINLLHTYTNNQQIKIATQNLLDMITVYNTVQSDHLRRFVPFRRQPQYVTVPQSWAGDGEYQRLGILVGNQNVFPEIRRTECIMTIQSTYRIDPIILDLFFPSYFDHPLMMNNDTTSYQGKSNTSITTNTTTTIATSSPNYFVGMTQVAEIYASTGTVLLSSGGHGTNGNIGHRQITPIQRPLVQRFNVRLRYIYNTYVVNYLLNLITDDERGWSRPTAIIPRSYSPYESSISDMVRFMGHRDVEAGAKEQNLCVAPNFICGLQLDYGNRLGSNDDVRNNCSITMGDWTFWNLYHNETMNSNNKTSTTTSRQKDAKDSICPNFGYYMAVYERQCDNGRCATKADTYGFIEIMEPNTSSENHTNNINFETFQEQVMTNNPNVFQSQGIMTYRTIDGHDIQFEIHPLDGQASIVQYDTVAYEREYRNWPIARSRTIQSTTPGRITIDNEKYYNQRLILDMTIPTLPRRFITTIPILRYSDHTIGTNEGRLFDDGSSVAPEYNIRKVTFYTNVWFQFVGYRMEWSSGLAVTHGSNGLYSSPHYFNDDESIIIMNVGMSRLWNTINYIQFQTNSGRRISSGYFGRDKVSFVSKPTEHICALYGRANGRGIDQLGAIYTPNET